MNIMKKQFPLCDFLNNNDAIHCASLVITPNLIEDDRGRKMFSQPSDSFSNGTITFIEYNRKTYGITCWHIIEIYRKKEKKYGEYSHTMRTIVNGTYAVIDRFVRPLPEFGQPRPDIAIREIDPEYIEKIGKAPIKLESLPEIPDDLNHAIAIGFPTKLKNKKEVNAVSHRISMPHLSIVAELNGGRPTQQFSMFSELEEEPDVIDYSGTSGGPIYWSAEENCGIIGIIYESAAGSELFGQKNIQVSGELATPAIIKNWIQEYHDNI
jgi:hypothetical protein